MSGQQENWAGGAVPPLLAGRDLALTALALALAIVCILLFAIRERDRVRELSGRSEEIKAAAARTQAQLESLTRRFDASVAAPASAERTYYPFQIARSKQFQRTGPLGISLRKADPKHKRFDMVMFVDGAQLEKKRVNLYEPVLVRLADRSQPVELVVNRIGKDRIAGYVSELKDRTESHVANPAVKTAAVLAER